jgi:hypothetical protein
MEITKIKLNSADVVKIEFSDFTKYDSPDSSGFLKIDLKRDEEIKANEEGALISYDGSVTAYKGEETGNLEDSSVVFKLDITILLKYEGLFDLDNLTDNIANNDWFFKKDASTFMHSVINRILSNTSYKNIILPYQQ